MKKKLRGFECPDCGGRFSVFLEAEAPPPDNCDLCGAYMGEPLQLTGKLKFLAQSSDPMANRNIAQMGAPLIGKAQNQSLDKTYRQMESASIGRAQDAADMAGVPVSEMSDLKITNMRDNLREGDTSAIMPVVSPAAQAAPMMQNTVGAATAAMTRQGPAAGAGTSFLDSTIRRRHAQIAPIVQRNGQTGSYTGR